MQVGILAAVLLNSGAADYVIPSAKGFGWGGDLNLEYIFEKLYCEESGQGYPRERLAEHSSRSCFTRTASAIRSVQR